MKTNNVDHTEKLFRRMQLKFTFIVSGICIALMAVCFVGAVSATLINMEMGIVSVLDRAVTLPLDTLLPDDAPGEDNEIAECTVAVVYRGNIIVTSKYDYLTDLQVRAIIGAAEDGSRDISLGDRRYRLATAETELGGNRVRVYAAYDVTHHLQTFLVQLAALAFALVGLVILVSLLTYLVSGKVLSPARDSLVKQKDLIANAGHELKTPVTIIGANLDVIRSDGGLTVDDNRKWLDNIEAQTKRMRDLITELLEMSSFESAAYKPEIASFDLSQLVEGACLSFEAACFERSVKLEMACEDATVVTSDRKAWEKLIGILLDNAVKYSEDGGSIAVSLSVVGAKKKKQVVFAVTNGGKTIPPEEIDRIFDRFHKVGDGSNSFGLGLAMAKTICQNMGGKITCASESGVTTFTVTAPINLS